MHYRLTLNSTEPIQLIDITESILQFCQEVRGNGILIASSLHTTGGVRINERCEHLEKDFKAFVNRLADPKVDYDHNRHAVDHRPNAHSHLLSFLIGSSETLVVEEGKPMLGTWQRVFFIELDGPRDKREVQLTFIPFNQR